MNFLKKGFNFYIHSSIHVAVSVTSLAALISLEFIGTYQLSVLWFIFLGTISGYNFVKYAGVAKLHHYSLTQNLKIIQVFSLFAFLGLLYFFTLQSRDFMVLTSFLGFCTILYAIPFFPKHTNLRNLKGTKIFIIAFVWAGVCVLLPLVENMPLLDWRIVVKWLQVFLFVISITIPFELRDLKYDDDSLGTLPQLIGIKNVKALGYFLMAVVILLQGFLYDFSWVMMFSVLLIGIVTIIAIRYAKKKQTKFYASFWVEAIPIVWLMLHLGILYLEK